MILHRYFARRFALTFGGVFAMFLLMLVFIDLIEQARRYGGAQAGMRDLINLSLLNVPKAIYQIIPLITIIATVSLFLSLSRSSEMVVTRASGRSALRALIAPVLVVITIGVLAVAILNPLVAATSREYEARANILRGSSSASALSEDGLWLRQGDSTSQSVIHATGANLDGTVLSGVSIYSYTADGQPEQRIEARAAQLVPGAWLLRDAVVWPPAGVANPASQATRHAELRVSSSLTVEHIRNSFGTPSSIPIWELPDFIKRLRVAGFSARRHEVFLQTELASPAFLVAMLLIGAAFTMRHQRGGRTGIMVLMAIMISFGAYFLRNFTQVLGESGQISPILAAWTPPISCIALALGLILHLEDG
ncbi:MAG: LPS export ABC transporter permease LptG [Rhodobacteraceae bacterium]|nr:LPS export ABC transporter permease LptG [Paracoccaceae bacterium]